MPGGSVRAQGVSLERAVGQIEDHFGFAPEVGARGKIPRRDAVYGSGGDCPLGGAARYPAFPTSTIRVPASGATATGRPARV